MDTQWPRYEVFEQERPDQPHRNAGAVHAPDAEMALQNARDVFSRRPRTVNLWVAPASRIYSRTAQELAADRAWQTDPAPPDAERQTYQVFCKSTQRPSETFVVHVGETEGRTPAEALRQALEQFGAHQAYVWWLVPEAAITRSEPDDSEPWFAPAFGKPFRQPNFYHVLSMMREVEAASAAKANQSESAEPKG